MSELEEKVYLEEQELEKNLQAMDDEREAHSNQMLGLERENDLLREQLKKYVSIVQAQRRDSPSVDPPSSGTLSGNLYVLVVLCYALIVAWYVLFQRLLVHQRTRCPLWKLAQTLQLTRNYRRWVLPGVGCYGEMVQHCLDG